MTEELYLILHKVRGEPAFDIATCIGEDGDGEIWIVPTSGHRAYPYRAWQLNALHTEDGYCPPFILDVVESIDGWPTWPDHYTITDHAEYGHHEVRKSAVSDLLRTIGRSKPSLIRRTVR